MPNKSMASCQKGDQSPPRMAYCRPHPMRLGADPRDILAGGIRPRVVVDLPDRGIGQRMAKRLAVAMSTAINAKDGPRGNAGPKRKLWPGVGGENAAEIVTESHKNLLRVGQVQVPSGLREKLSDAPHQRGTRSGSSCAKAASTRWREFIVRPHYFRKVEIPRWTAPRSSSAGPGEPADRLRAER